MDHPIIDDETELLQQVRRWLHERPYEATVSETHIVGELVRMREELLEAKEEDQPALMQQIEHHAAWAEQLRQRVAVTPVDPDNPYFAHLRLLEGGRTRDVFLGKTTRIGEGLRIVDWRNAPISRLFYRYTQGDDYEEELGNRVHIGEVLARRVVAVERGILVRIEAPEGSFVQTDTGWVQRHREAPRLAGGGGETVRAYALGEAQDRRMGTDLAGGRRRADKRLPDIAGLIDEDQFKLISAPDSGLVVIRGTAGSGKTTVALHRIAYLAYSDPEVDSERTLFVVASPALCNYVAHVLPALGVPKAQVVTFGAWCAEQRRRHFPKLPTTVRPDTPAAVVRLKLHPAFLIALTEQLERHRSASATPEQVIDDYLSTTTGRERLEAVFREHAPDLLTAEDWERVHRWMTQQAEDLQSWLDGDHEVAAGLDEEDDALLLRAWQLRIGSLRGRRGVPMRYRHIAVDEVQDFAPTEIQVLIDCLDSRRSLTLAGDTQQHVMTDAGFTSWNAFFGHLGLPGTEVETLRVSYRSSRPIVSFALALLGDLREDGDPPIVVRDGPPVEVFRFTDSGAAVAFLAIALTQLVEDEPLASIVLLTPNADVTAEYAGGLMQAEVPRVRRVMDHDFSFAPGIEVTEVAQVKGLEFDYVVIVEASARAYPDVPANRRLLHVAATRAIHQLWVTSVDEPSSILPREAL